MIKPLASASSSASPFSSIRPGDDRLDSWKEIASYLRREVRTGPALGEEGGPAVHRHFHTSQGSVFALRSEIENWKRRVSRECGNLEIEPIALASNRSREAGERITIYVLPFKNVTVSSDRRRVCDTIVAKTITALEQLNPAQLRIVNPSPQQERREFPATNLAIADEAVNYLLQWSVQDDGNSMRVNVALLFAAADVVAWSHTYRCRPNDLEELPSYIRRSDCAVSLVEGIFFRDVLSGSGAEREARLA